MKKMGTKERLVYCFIIAILIVINVFLFVQNIDQQIYIRSHRLAQQMQGIHTPSEPETISNTDVQSEGEETENPLEIEE